MRLDKVKFCFFFFNDTATTEIYTLSLHDALPICCWRTAPRMPKGLPIVRTATYIVLTIRSEEHTSELQSQSNLVCRLLLEKKKKIQIITLMTRSLDIARTFFLFNLIHMPNGSTAD